VASAAGLGVAGEAALDGDSIARLLLSRMGLVVDEGLAGQLATYLALLVKWNARTNLSAIREPEQMVLRHFGECLQCAAALPAGVSTLLDYGSGAGFPGAVCALRRPEIAVVLAESQNKKAAFLEELRRSLPLPLATVHGGRVEALPVERLFDAVTLRAVDRMQEACDEARSRVKPGGWLVVMTTRGALGALAEGLDRMAWRPPVTLMGTEQGVVAMGRVLVGP
jgi:16S rRNA (guanine527-N7)-methyltransferase